MYMGISIVIAPSDAPQVPATCPQAVPRIHLDPMDLEIIRIIGTSGQYGMHIWKALDLVATAQNPICRAERRSIRLNVWEHLRTLLRTRLVFRHQRKFVTLTNLPKLTVTRRRRSRAGSTIKQATISKRPISSNHLNSIWSEQMAAASPATAMACKTKSAVCVVATSKPTDLTPSKIEPVPLATMGDQQKAIYKAAQSIARLPRRRKTKWSGFIGRVRSFRDMVVRLPTGEQVYVYGTLRGKIIYTRDRGILEDGPNGVGVRWDVVSAGEVKIVKNWNAILLGSLKRGRRECPSVLKAEAARNNGRKPVSAGHRPRGRPRKNRTGQLKT
ncbi:MAG: hypothetical protein JWR19_826 [Pedosphaera sp.]|nr:hypothetical protein [Pedosphaera sp.]